MSKSKTITTVKNSEPYLPYVANLKIGSSFTIFSKSISNKKKIARRVRVAVLMFIKDRKKRKLRTWHYSVELLPTEVTCSRIK